MTSWSDCNTGDLILVSGDGAFSKIIKEAAGVPFSHMAMVVEGAHIGRVRQIYAWEATGRGVGEVPLEKSINVSHVDFFTRIVNPGAGDVVVRRLGWPSTDVYLEAVKRFRRHREEVNGRPYEVNKREMLNACFPWLGPLLVGATEQDLSSVYCWECVAAAWQAMGILPEDKAANSYSIRDFMGNNLPLQQGITLGPSITI